MPRSEELSIGRRPGALMVAGACLIGVGCATTLQHGPPRREAPECQANQVQVLLLGTFHFHQQSEVDVLGADFQAQLDTLLDRLAQFDPDRVAVEHAYSNNEALNAQYRLYLQASESSLSSANETGQIGFRLARRLGHGRVYAVDVPMNLWHDSIQVFDDRFPGARNALRSQWDTRYPNAPRAEAGKSLVDLLRPWNDGSVSGMPEYGLFMPLVAGEVYAGALKLRPWYDRNLRIVQNFFRALEEGDDRLFMVVGGSHIPVLRHLIDMTPQLCVVDPLPYLSG